MTGFRDNKTEKEKNRYCSLRAQQRASRCTEIMLCMISRRNSRVFCELCSQKTPRGTLLVNSRKKSTAYKHSTVDFLHLKY